MIWFKIAFSIALLYLVIFLHFHTVLSNEDGILKKFWNNVNRVSKTVKRFTFLKFDGSPRKNKRKLEELFISSCKVHKITSRIALLNDRKENEVINGSDDVIKGSDDVIQLSLIEQKSPSTIFISLMYSGNDRKLTQKIIDNKAFSSQPWIIFAKQNIRFFLQDFWLPLNNRVTLVEESEYGNELTLWDAYKATINSPMMYNSIGEIRVTNNDVKKHGLKNLELEPWSRRKNFNGLEIICTVLDTNPENILIENGDGMVKDVGNLGQLYQIIVNSLNATTRCSRPSDNQWGFLTSNNSWVGMIGELVRGKADIIASAADFTYDRQVSVDFFTPLHISRYVLVIKNPKVHGKNVYSTYGRVFSFTSWIIIVLFAFAFSIVFFYERRFCNPQTRISFLECLLIASGAFCYQGHTLRLQMLSEKLLFNTLFLLGLLLNIYYSSYLTSLLAVNEPQIPFTNIDGLYNRRGEYKFDFTRGGSLNILIKDSPRKILNKVWKDMVDESYKQNPVYLTEEESLRRVLTENVALLISEKYMLNNYFDSCSFAMTPEAVFKVPSGWAMRKNSPLFPIINHRLQKLVEGGIYKRLLHQTRPFSPAFCSTSSVFQPFDFIKIVSIFIAFGMGISISLFILIVEILFTRNRRH